MSLPGHCKALLSLVLQFCTHCSQICHPNCHPETFPFAWDFSWDILISHLNWTDLSPGHIPASWFTLLFGWSQMFSESGGGTDLETLGIHLVQPFPLFYSYFSVWQLQALILVILHCLTIFPIWSFLKYILKLWYCGKLNNASQKIFLKEIKIQFRGQNAPIWDQTDQS